MDLKESSRGTKTVSRQCFLAARLAQFELRDHVAGARRSGRKRRSSSLRFGVVSSDELCGGDEAVDGSRTPAALIGPGEGPIFSSHGDRP